jgi:hypothetical protein
LPTTSPPRTPSSRTTNFQKKKQPSLQSTLICISVISFVAFTAAGVRGLRLLENRARTLLGTRQREGRRNKRQFGLEVSESANCENQRRGANRRGRILIIIISVIPVTTTIHHNSTRTKEETQLAAATTKETCGLHSRRSRQLKTPLLLPTFCARSTRLGQTSFHPLIQYSS